MNTPRVPRAWKALSAALIGGLLVCAPNLAGAAGHFGGSIGVHGGAFRAGGGFRGGYGWHGGYGWRGGYGFRGGFGYGWWGWPGYGLFLATLPLYYSTYWWDGVPYYYADDSYYVWNGAAGGYQVVTPPPQIANQGGSQPGNGELFAYPRNGQSAEQQARDKQECRAWAASQVGAPPPAAAPAGTAGAPSAVGALRAAGAPNEANAPGAGNRNEELRAQTACLEGRGYSVR